MCNGSSELNALFVLVKGMALLETKLPFYLYYIIFEGIETPFRGD